MSDAYRDALAVSKHEAKRGLIAEGNYLDLIPEPYAPFQCQTCGAVVSDREKHDAWHRMYTAPEMAELLQRMIDDPIGQGEAMGEAAALLARIRGEAE